MADRQRVSTGSPYEIIAVTGTAPLGPDGRTIGVGDPGAQTRRCLEIIAESLRKLGSDLEDVVRTRIFLTRIEDWEAVGNVHGEFFGDIRPANTMVQVTRFIDPEWLVEIEADAVVGDGGPDPDEPTGPR
jgi:enamine deaminase RidA (YjgF/YER057c/UK114 family)